VHDRWQLLRAPILSQPRGCPLGRAPLGPENTATPTVSPTQPYVERAGPGRQRDLGGRSDRLHLCMGTLRGTCETIAGQTGTSCTPVQSDIGKTLRFVVTATNATGSTTVSSAAISVVVNSLKLVSLRRLGRHGRSTKTLPAPKKVPATLTLGGGPPAPSRSRPRTA
jgi:hypothetical protein